MSCKWVGRGQFEKTRPKARGINSPISPQCKGLNFSGYYWRIKCLLSLPFSYYSCSLFGHLRSKDPNNYWKVHCSTYYYLFQTGPVIRFASSFSAGIHFAYNETMASTGKWCHFQQVVRIKIEAEHIRTKITTEDSQTWTVLQTTVIDFQWESGMWAVGTRYDLLGQKM